jgi:hypothetical protein
MSNAQLNKSLKQVWIRCLQSLQSLLRLDQNPNYPFRALHFNGLKPDYFHVSDSMPAHIALLTPNVYVQSIVTHNNVTEAIFSWHIVDSGILFPVLGILLPVLSILWSRFVLGEREG